ncbi:MAG: hypothetical protein OXG74_02790, partial [Acidobacteria bacterium]|nr:hypothetical protein [Acidobacteriota bacterium]
MMTSRMGGPGCVGLRRVTVAGLFLALAFTAGAASAGDNAAFVSYTGVPSAMHPGDTATVTVKMKNTGTTTWESSVVTQTHGSVRTTTRTTYLLKAIGHGWGVNGVAVTGSVAPNASRSFEFTITAPQTTTKRNYAFRWQMSRKTVVTERPTGRPMRTTSTQGTAFGAATPNRTIQVGPDTAPSFGNKTIPNQEWLRGKAIDAVTLPAATGGNGPLSYALSGCYLPGGVTFDRATRRLNGTPRTAWGPTTCTYKVTDADDNTAAGDAAELEFTIRVKRPVLTVSPDLTVTEGDSGTFTVQPSMQPTGTVTVTVSSGDTKVATVSPASLTFTATNYTTAKTVTVTGVKDVDGLDDSTTVRLSASSGGYNNVSASVNVTVDDSYEPPVVPQSLTVVEGGSTPFTVALATQPTGTVTVSVSSADTEVAGVTESSLTFTRTNYSTPQTVNVTGAQDDDASDENTTVEVAANGGGYGGESASVKVRVNDDDERGLIVSPSKLTIDEGNTGSFTVALATRPTGAVTVRVSSGDTGVATVSPSSLTFRTTSYSTPQTVTVTVGRDADASDENTSVNLRASGGDYGGISASVPVMRTDPDIPVLLVSPSELTVDETDTGSFTVALATRPTGTVTVSVASGDTGAVTVSKSSLTFRTTNYGTPQTVTVTGVDDADASDESTTVRLRASGGDYGNVSASVSVSVTDDDTQGLMLSKASVAVAEGGSNTFKVKLATQPTASVTVSVSSQEAGEATASLASLSFSTANYGTWQTVTVRGVEDPDAEDEATTVDLSASGGDYGNVSASVRVTVDDDDMYEPPIVPRSVEVNEGGTATFSVTLSTQPTSTVTVSVSSGDTGAATASPASLSFTAANYSTSQTVTVTGVQDADASDERTSISVSASGGGYGGESSSVSVTVTDDDTQGL